MKSLVSHERDLYKKGFEAIAGVDEAGRSSLAGPMVAAAVALNINHNIKGIKDSKKLSPNQRENLFNEVINNSESFSIIQISSFEIDRIGLQKANLFVLEEAVKSLSPKPDFVLCDGFKINTELPNLKVLKGDSVSITIAAASILAKVFRDRLMDGYDAAFPGYKWSKNKGYGTKIHMEALSRLGPSIIHRCTFKPVQESPGAKPNL